MKFSEVTDSMLLLSLLRKSYPLYNTDVVAIDKLKSIKQSIKQIVIVNFDNHIGTHWSLIVVKGNREAFYFDPYGLDRPEPILNYMRKYKFNGLVKNLISNIREIQPVSGKGSKACGLYCLNLLKFYINEDQESYDAVVSVTVKNTLSYGRKLMKSIK